jgi:anti-anti-sigma regulatory factor
VWSRQSRPTATFFDAEPGGPVLVVLGGVDGSSLHRFAGAMELVLNSHSSRFVVDVSEVDEWSLAAQAMVLVTARQKAARGEQLVLRGASPALREQSRQLELFEHVRSIDAQRPAGGAA